MHPRKRHHGPIEKLVAYISILSGLTGLFFIATALGSQAKHPKSPYPTSSESCIHCHKTMAGSKAEGGQHPLSMLSHHPLKDFECTDCHRPVISYVSKDPRESCPAVNGDLLTGGYVQASCGTCHESTYNLKGAETALWGKNLFRERGCHACHSPKPSVKKFAPPLNGISEKIKNRRWLQAWLLGPRSIRPGTMMPDFRLSPESACNIATFLLSLTASHQYKSPDLNDRSPSKGAEYFIYRGCIACHSVNPDSSSPAHRIPSLNDAGTKLRPSWVLLELEDPRAYNPDATIPLIDATEDEVFDIMAYLETLTLDPKDLAPWCNGSSGDPETGREIIQEAGCYNCHHIRGFDHSRKQAGRTAPFHPLGNELRSGKDGKQAVLRHKQAEPRPSRPIPVFNLTDAELTALTVFLMSPSPSMESGRFVPKKTAQILGHDGQMLIHDYGCRQCHQFAGGKRPHVTLKIERNHLIPPVLRGEGAKVQPQWLDSYLKKPFRMRQWMSMGMPFFYLSDQETGIVVKFFRNRSGLNPEWVGGYHLPFNPEKMNREDVDMGLYRFRHDRCAQCHPAGLDKTLPEGVVVDDLAIDLLMTKHRLRYEWVGDFLRNPDRFAGEGTRMPFIYFTPDGRPKVPEADQWLDRVARVLYTMETLPENEKNDHVRDAVDVDRFWDNY